MFLQLNVHRLQIAIYLSEKLQPKWKMSGFDAKKTISLIEAHMVNSIRSLCSLKSIDVFINLQKMEVSECTQV